MPVHVEVRFPANQILSSFSCIALLIVGEPANHCMKEWKDGQPVKVAADPPVIAPMTGVCGCPCAPYLGERDIDMLTLIALLMAPFRSELIYNIKERIAVLLVLPKSIPIFGARLAFFSVGRLHCINQVVDNMGSLSANHPFNRRARCEMGPAPGDRSARPAMFLQGQPQYTSSTFTPPRRMALPSRFQPVAFGSVATTIIYADGITCSHLHRLLLCGYHDRTPGERLTQSGGLNQWQ